MADVINLAAESGRNIIGDDASPTLTLENTSSGQPLKLQNAGGTGVQLSGISCPTTAIDIASGGKGSEIEGAVASTFNSSATAEAALAVGHLGAVLGSPTIGTFAVMNSTASGAFFEFKGAFMSTASINISADKTVFVIPVTHESGALKGYIPVFTGVT